MTSIPYPLTDGTATPFSARLSLDAATFRRLFDSLGPSLGLWRGAEIAMLRTCVFERPILDLGCGDGLVTSFVLAHVDIGVDPWPRAIEAASRRGTYGTLVARPIQRSQVAPGSVRTIISNSVLEHLPVIDGVLGTAARLLMPGGRILFTVPTEAFPRWLIVPYRRYGAWRNRAYEHRNLWTSEEWSRRLGAAGLEIEEVRPYLRRPLVAVWDGLELAQRVWIGRRRVFGEVWKRLPGPFVHVLAKLAEAIDLSAPHPGGGRLIVASKRSAP